MLEYISERLAAQAVSFEVTLQQLHGNYTSSGL